MFIEASCYERLSHDPHHSLLIDQVKIRRAVRARPHLGAATHPHPPQLAIRAFAPAHLANAVIAERLVDIPLRAARRQIPTSHITASPQTSRSDSASNRALWVLLTGMLLVTVRPIRK